MEKKVGKKESRKKERKRKKDRMETRKVSMNGKEKSEYKLWQKQKVNKSKYKHIVFDNIPSLVI